MRVFSWNSLSIMNMSRECTDQREISEVRKCASLMFSYFLIWCCFVLNLIVGYSDVQKKNLSLESLSHFNFDKEIIYWFIFDPLLNLIIRSEP